MRNLLKVLTKQQRAMIQSVERESGLVDDCQYMVYLKEGFRFADELDSFPVKNARELKELMEDVEQSYH